MYAYGMDRYTIRVWYNFLYHTRMVILYAYTRLVHTIRIWYDIRIRYTIEQTQAYARRFLILALLAGL